MSTPGVNHRNYLDTAPNKPVAAIRTSKGFNPEFPGEAICGIFPGIAKNIFPESAKSGETSFYPLETKKRTLVAKNVIGKCQNSKSKGSYWPSQTPSDAHEHGTSSPGAKKLRSVSLTSIFTASSAL